MTTPQATNPSYIHMPGKSGCAHRLEFERCSRCCDHKFPSFCGIACEFLQADRRALSMKITFDAALSYNSIGPPD